MRRDRAQRHTRTGSRNDDEPADGEGQMAVGENTRSRQITPREYAAYRMCTRAGQTSLIHRAGRLMQQYAVDQCCKIEEQRLKFHREHQAQLRADAYAGIMDFAGPMVNPLPEDPLEHDRTLGQAGTRIILAPSFPGGERYMRAQYQDSMAIVRAIGKPDLFITVTCYPKWVEVSEALLPRQHAADRPDLTARVFRLKLKSILDDLSAGVLGLEIARIHVIEYQKRGLPHAHCLLMLAEADKPRSVDDYDRLVSAEIPDPENEQLYQTVRMCMMHGPCGRSNPDVPCMKDGVCSKRFPKNFTNETKQADDGYPVYRRRNDGRTVTVKGVHLDNRYVVPYNPWLCHKYDCHINVEVCSSVASIKYLYKYVYKGHDRVVISPSTSLNEIQEYIDARYISASQAMTIIFGFEMQAKTVTVVVLPIHLENQQGIVFNSNENIESVIERGHHTMLTRFFQLMANDPYARNLTYQELPTYFRYAKPTQRLPWHEGSGCQWIQRICDASIVIGRMVYCPMSQMERYCLRLMLCYRKGPTSFEDLRTVDGIVYASYHEAATMAGLLQDDHEWDRAMQEAVSFHIPSQLRHLFAIILSQQPQNPRRLYLRQMTPSKTLTNFPDMPQLADFQHLPMHLQSDQHNDVNSHIDAERSYSINVLDETIASINLLNSEQRVVYDIVTAAVDRIGPEIEDFPEEHHNLFFLDGPGGTGKSFLLEKILAYTRRKSKIALAAAASDIAALLLTGGRTVHTTFKLPLVLDEYSTCNIPTQSSLADLMRQTSLIVWDEASMSSRFALEAVDRSLQDIVGVHRPFGGKVVLLCGDFRQILPIVPKDVFAHGQLYVALSRVTSRKNVAVLIVNPDYDLEGVTVRNIVYHEVID
uniref:uncharacterized protein LOC120956157 n=1 Tax=Anopheles coluzzii TaxID=1518534 RepID=UPI0020FFB91C|nr:uncharacterized protein LOC120956157 [Anopheles coluzzii]